MTKLLNDSPEGGLVTGIKVAAASKLLENHPHLQTGAIVGLVVAEAEKVVNRSTNTITGAMAEIAAGQEKVEATRHGQILAKSDQLAEITGSLVENTRTATHEKELREIEVELKSIVESSPEYLKSRQVISDAELYALLQYLAKYHQNDFKRAVPSDPRDLWKYRAAMTLALGPDQDYGVDHLQIEDIDLDLEATTHPIVDHKPKTVVLNLLRRQYLRLLAAHQP